MGVKTGRLIRKMLLTWAKLSLTTTTKKENRGFVWVKPDQEH